MSAASFGQVSAFTCRVSTFTCTGLALDVHEKDTVRKALLLGAIRLRLARYPTLIILAVWSTIVFRPCPVSAIGLRLAGAAHG